MSDQEMATEATLQPSPDFDQRPSIEEILARASEGEDMDVALIMAESLNLALLANYKLRNKRIFTAVDTQNILRLWRTLIGTPVRPIGGLPPRRVGPERR
jgi:hypothetical protein